MVILNASDLAPGFNELEISQRINSARTAESAIVVERSEERRVGKEC